MVKFFLLTIIMILGSFNFYIAWEYGYKSVFPPFEFFPANQMFLDLAISLTMIMIWMVWDWKKQNKPFYKVIPFLIGTILFGSIGPLFYLYLRKHTLLNI